MSAAGILERIDADLIEPQRLAGSVVDQLRIERRRQPYRPRGITAREGMQAIRFEAFFTVVCAENQARGLVLSDDDRARLLVASGLIQAILAEVLG